MTASLADVDTVRWAPRPMVALVVTAMAHFLAARLAALWTVDPTVAQPFWLATGVSVGIGLASPTRVRPFVVAGAIIGQAFNTALFIHADISDVAGDVSANGVEIAVGIAVFGWWFGRAAFTGRSTWTIAAFGLCFAVSSVGAAIAVLWFQPSNPVSYMGRWVLGDALGIAAVGAFFLIPSGRVSWRVGAEEGAGPVELVVTLAATGALVAWSISSTESFLYLVVAALMWLAVRFGPAVSVPMALAVAMVACIVTVRGGGPFGEDGSDGVVHLQAFNATILFSTLLVGRITRAGNEARKHSEAVLIAIPDLVSIRRVSPGRHDQPGLSSVERVSGTLGSTELDARVLAAVASVDTGVMADVEASGRRIPVTRIDLPIEGDPRQIEHRTVVVDPRHSLTLSRDVSEEITLWRRANAAEQRWRRLATSAYEGYLEIDSAGIIVEVTDRLAEMLETTVDDLQGRPFADLLDADDLARIEPRLRQVQGGDRITFETLYRTRRGHRRWALVTAEPADQSAQAGAGGLVVFAADTTETHEAAEGRRLAELQLATVEERERRRIARDLHDGPLQSLVAISYQLNALRHGAGDERAAGHLEDLALAALRQMRAGIEDLAPVEITPSGLLDAFHDLAARFETPTAPMVRFDDALTRPLTSAEATSLYRIGSEAIVNAILHSGGSLVTVRISDDGPDRCLEVIDDGSGLDHDTVGRDEGHLGMRAMRERTLERGGTIVITDALPHGTAVTVRLPADTRTVGSRP